MNDQREDASDPLFREEQTGFLALRLVTEVRDDGVYLKFAPVHRSFHRIPWENVDGVAEATYDPTEYGGLGWGIRVGPTGTTKAYRISGDSGVEIRRTEGRDLFVGTRRPSELVAAIGRARSRAHRG
jgi:hypothetical protein